MPIIASAKGGGDFPKVPAGSHASRCINVIDLGTQTVTWQGSEKKQRKLWLTFEVPEETIEIDGKKKPMVISRKFTLSLADTGHLLPFLESWRGKRFSETELDAFDVSKLLGQPALISVVHDKKDGKEYANIASASQLPKGMTVVPNINPLVEYSVDSGENTTYHSLPEFLQKMISASDEFKNADRDFQQPSYGDEDAPPPNEPEDLDSVPF